MSVPSRCCSASHSCLISTSLMRCRLWHKKIWLGVTELLFMVRKLNHRFKNFLTMSSSVCNAVMMCHRERYGHKMAFAARF
ncbi:hypothetical protein SY86_06945 [Erwinia tracheiphila]|uniref:Uncharacterized protein n=1 Tax=Erwinia tracheiphila TaxID=65700 RepID=A0A0M2K8G1_9GAMM|nr:hypothetical protein SY86_06945 [Erwinia tracheiphila]